MAEAERRKNWAAALGRIPSGLFIVTARHGTQETGMLASWVQQCSFNPPQVSLALKQGRELATWLTAGAPFVVNILDDTQTGMIVHFGRGFDVGQPAFEGLELERTSANVPILAEALAHLECHVEQSFPIGDHTLFVAQVTGGRVQREGHAMVHHRRNGLHY